MSVNNALLDGSLLNVEATCSVFECFAIEAVGNVPLTEIELDAGNCDDLGFMDRRSRIGTNTPLGASKLKLNRASGQPFECRTTFPPDDCYDGAGFAVP